MSYPVRIAIFILILIGGSLLIEILAPKLAYVLVSMTGWGWLFAVLKGMMLGAFWAIMILLFLPKKNKPSAE